MAVQVYPKAKFVNMSLSIKLMSRVLFGSYSHISVRAAYKEKVCTYNGCFWIIPAPKICKNNIFAFYDCSSFYVDRDFWLAVRDDIEGTYNHTDGTPVSLL